VDEIALARCARERRCGNVGVEEDYASDADCVTEVKADWRDDLNALDCPGGIDGEALSDCLDEIRDEDCGDPVESLQRIAACNAADICE
jgi:hypothetical protein